MNLCYAQELLILTILLFSLGIVIQSTLLTVFSVLFLAWVLFFFRDTYVPLNSSPGNFVSPSSSKITEIFANGVKTYLSPLDVHFLVSPISGTVIEIKKNPSPTDAERVQMIMETEQGIFIIEQAVSKLGYGPWLSAFLIDDRIKLSVKEGDQLIQGQKYGMIRFGSEMAYYFPDNYQIVVSEGQKCKIGKTVIAKLFTKSSR